MTRLTTSPSAEHTHPLSPFQRAALAYPSRPVTLVVDVPLVPELLIKRAAQALQATPELTVVLSPVQGTLIPRQAPCAPEGIPLSDGSWELRAGCLSLKAEPRDVGSRLTIDTDGVSADAAAIELFCERIAHGENLLASPAFLAVGAEHAAMLQEGELEQEKTYWRAILPGTDPRPALGCAPGAVASRVSVALRVSEGPLSNFAAASDVNPTAVVYLALRLLVDRVCEEGGALSYLFNVRDLMSLEGVGGLLTQVLPDNDRIDADMTAQELLERQVERHRMHAEMAGAPALAERSAPPTIVFDSRAEWRLPHGWRFIDAFEGRFGALVLRASRREEYFALVAEACDGCKEEGLGGLLSAWAGVLDAIVHEPETPWCALQMERQRDAPPPAASTEADDICLRLAQFARESGTAVAVRHGACLISRAALMERVIDVAGTIGPLQDGSIVAVLAGPEFDLVAGWLAVLWRGAAFLPLLPTEPGPRIEHALEASRASVLLIADGAPPFSAPEGCRVVRLSEVTPWAGGLIPATPMRPGQIGYVLRTSGTSGRPKLVAIRRTSLNNYLRWVADEVLSDDSDMPVIASPIFDASFKQLLGPLYAGRATWLLGADPVDAPQAYAELAQACNPLVLNCTPTYWTELLDAGMQGGHRLPLRRLMLGGEHISDTLRKRTVTAFPSAEIWNLYGPTEATATATAGRLEPGEPIHAGHPLAGATVTVRDRFARALPWGMRGEVWISGPGVAEGYLGTGDASPFVALKQGGVSFASYRTGDIGYIDDRGRLRLAGRLDSQLKLRGWRIEPQEIEAVAESTPGVVTAKVILDTTGESHRLCLFVVGHADESAVAKVLRERLPAAMVPAKVMKVARLPRTVTGKLDDRALLEMSAATAADPAREYEPLQLEIATLWRGLVGQHWPRLDEDFFSAGGHSLLLARLVNQLRSRGYLLSLRQIVRNPTINSIVDAIQAAGSRSNA